MEMEMESPECPVCLQNYDGDTVIPRVLACGHTACEACLLNLPQRYSHTIRCPECNQLVNYPSQGPTALPKNIDLLRLSLSHSLSENSHKPDKTPPNYDPCHSQSHHFLPRFWSHEFFSLWKRWVLPNDAVLIEGEGEEAEMIRVGLYENQRVSVLRLVSLHDDDDSSVFRYSYVVKVMNCLSGMREEEREELGLILRAQKKFVCKVFGLWGDLEGGFLSLVCERQNGSLLEKFGDLGDRFCGEGEEGLSKDGISGFAMIGAGICEAVIALHFEGLVIGCLDLSCFSFDAFGRVCVDLSAVLVAGRKLRKHVVEAVSGKLRIDDNEMGVIFSGLLKNEAFLSPQLLLELLQKEGIAVECGSSRCSVDCSSDVWSLACVLMRLLIGKKFTEGTLEICTEKGSDYSTLHTGWVEKVRSLLETNLGSEYASLSQILYKCLNFDQGSCPLATDVWRCIRELLIKPKFDITGGFEWEIKENNTYHCLIFGKLCQLPTESAEIQEEDGGADFDQVNKRVDKSFVEGLSEGVIKCKDLQGHLDCITELAVGGGFLFSSSFDKTVQVWSLQDFSHIHTFRGHEHRVTALVYVDEEQLCISGDNSGGIFVWAIRVPFGQDPIKKWYEEKDWRYSGIHALTISGNGYLYTGSGDKSIKAWSLKDGALYCTMNGHKSVVSTLAVCDGVLYSGSWDGTIRLWSLNDHSALAVLGEDMPGNVTSVLSLTADGDMLIASFENGCIKVWRNDLLMKSVKLHQGAIFTTGMEGKWLFTGGWDKILKVQELLDDEFQIDITPTGSIPCGSVITALLCWQGKLIVGYADRSIKVYFYGK